MMEAWTEMLDVSASYGLGAYSFSMTHCIERQSTQHIVVSRKKNNIMKITFSNCVWYDL
jgi:hypothetical protein